MEKPNKTTTWFQVMKKVSRSPSKEKSNNKYSDMLKINSPMHYCGEFCTNLNVTKLTRLEQYIKS
jgi:hypothetical protein